MTTAIGFIQFHVAFGDKATNFSHVETLLEGAPHADLLVLPELAFTGYEFLDQQEVAQHAEPLSHGPTSAFLTRLAQKHNTVFVAGYAENDNGTFYNSAMMATPAGDLFNYRKIHLFNRENDLFTPGNLPPAVFHTPAGRVGMMICFDWFFPEVARTLALAGAQVIAHPSNLVLPWCQRAMFCRSVENHVYTVTANRTGTEDRAGRSITFTGASQVLNPIGEKLVSAPVTGSAVMTAPCDPAEADNKQINPHNHLLTDRRLHLYKLQHTQDASQ